MRTNLLVSSVILGDKKQIVVGSLASILVMVLMFLYFSLESSLLLVVVTEFSPLWLAGLVTCFLADEMGTLNLNK